MNNISPINNLSLTRALVDFFGQFEPTPPPTYEQYLARIVGRARDSAKTNAKPAQKPAGDALLSRLCEKHGRGDL